MANGGALEAAPIGDRAVLEAFAFANRFWSAPTELALHAALPLGLTPELLHLIRVNFVPEADWIAEADLLLSPLCSEVGAGLYLMDPDVKDLLLGELTEDADAGQTRVMELSTLLYHFADRELRRETRPELRRFFEAERWTARARLRPRETAEMLASALRDGMSSESVADQSAAARLLRQLAGPLALHEELVVYAAGVDRMLAGDDDGARRRLGLIADLGRAVSVGEITLPDASSILGEEAPVAEGEGTDAPGGHERVRITFDVETGGVVEQKELPFVIAVLADLGGDDDAGELEERRMLRVGGGADARDVDGLMRMVAPRLRLRVEDLREGAWPVGRVEPGGQMALELTFERLADFEPYRLVPHVGWVRQLGWTRARLAWANEGFGPEKDPEFWAEWEKENVYSGETGVRQELLERLARDVGDRAMRLAEEFPEEAARLRVERDTLSTDYLEAVFTLGSRVAEGVDPPRLIAAIDRMIEDQLRVVYRHEAFQRLEAAWRGLDVLVRHSAPGDLLHVEVLPVRAEERAQAEAILHRKLLEERYGAFGGEPIGLIVTDYELGPDVDGSGLAALARVAAACEAPALVSARPSVLGMSAWSEAARASDFRVALPEGLASSIDSRDARYVVATLPGMLLREDRMSRAMLGQVYDDGATRPDPGLPGPGDGGLFGAAAWGLGAVVARAFNQDGWCARILGPVDGALPELVDRIARYEVGRKEDPEKLRGPGAMGAELPDEWVVTPPDSGRAPVEVLLGDRQEVELAQMGLATMRGDASDRTAAFLSLPSLATQRDGPWSKESDPSAGGGTLPYTLTAARFAHYVGAMVRDRIGAYTSPDELQYLVTEWIQGYVAGSGATTKAGIDGVVGPDKPLLDAKVDIEGWGEGRTAVAVLSLVPAYQLERSDEPIRVVAPVPSPQSPPPA